MNFKIMQPMRPLDSVGAKSPMCVSGAAGPGNAHWPVIDIRHFIALAVSTIRRHKPAGFAGFRIGGGVGNGNAFNRINRLDAPRIVEKRVI